MSCDSNQAVCFLLGLPRSGTTLLAHLLQQHPDLLAPPEPWLMLALEAFGTVDQRHPAEAFLIRDATEEFFGRIDRAAACRALADNAYGQYLAAAGKRCFIDKTPRCWMAVDFIDTLYPEAPHIVLMRNPYAIAASLKSTWGIPLLPESCPPARAPYLADLVLGLPVLAARRDRPKTQVVRYEALVEQTGEEIRRVVTALGYDPAGITSMTIGKTDYLKSGNFGDRKILDKKTIDDRSVHAWQTELSTQEMQAVTDMVGAELLIELGYDQEFQWAREAGVVDSGDAVTHRHRQVFQTWWNLRAAPKVAPGFREPARAEQQSDAAAQAGTESPTSAPDLSAMQTARLLAEFDTERTLRQANAKTDELQEALAASEADRAARLDAIHERDATIATLQSEVARLGQALTASETDRAARLAVIHERDATIATLQSEVARLGQALTASEADRAARLAVIHERDATIAALQSEVAGLGQALTASEADRAARLAVIHERDATIDALQSEVARVGQALAASEADRIARLAVIHQRDSALAFVQNDLDQLQAAFAESEADRAARLAVIHERDTAINALKAEIEQAQGSLGKSNTVLANTLGSRWWRLGRRLNVVPPTELPLQKMRMFRSETPEVLAFHAASTARALEKIAARDLEISTVVDVGASNGMWSAVTRQSYPEAGYLLIEAQKVHEPALINYCRANSNTTYVLAAAGDSVGQIYFDDNAPFGGVASHQPTEAARSVLPVTTIDHEVSVRGLNGPFLVKLDTHGFEVPIFEGASETLKQANLVVIEVYNFKITDHSLLFDEMCAYMRTLGFGVIDISEPLWRQRDNAFWQMDLFFIPLTRPEFAARTYT